MKTLVIFRHGNYKYDSILQDNDSKCLSRDGAFQFLALSRKINETLPPDAILNSPLTRAKESASIASAVTGLHTECNEYLSEDEIGTPCIKGLDNKHDTVWIVTHLPTIGSIVNILCTPDDIQEFKMDINQQSSFTFKTALVMTFDTDDWAQVRSVAPRPLKRIEATMAGITPDEAEKALEVCNLRVFSKKSEIINTQHPIYRFKKTTP